MKHLRLPSFAACAVALGLTAGCASPPESRTMGSPPELGPCDTPGLPASARCGTYAVYEDREAGTGRRIELYVVHVPASGGHSARDAITYFEGGPGGAATESATQLLAIYPKAHETRDLLLMDARGTGRSHSLRCSYQDERLGYTESFLPVDGVEECWREVSERADPDLYTTRQAVDDMDELREAFGFESLNVLGGSYGTRMALVYMRRYPTRVRTALLSGPVPTDTRSPVTFAADAQAALDGLFQECAEDAECAAAFPNLQADLQATFARLEAGPVEVEVLHPETGEPQPMQLSRDAVAQTLRYMLYGAGTALRLPAHLRAAAEGRFGPLGQVTSGYAGFVDSGSDGYYLSVTCSEDVPFFELDEARRRSADTFLGVYRAEQAKAACAAWPVEPVPDRFLEPVSSPAPTLLLVGERDPVTPVRWAQEVARHLPNSRTLIVPDGAHGQGGLRNADCLDTLAEELLFAGSVAGLDLESCRSSIGRPPFLLELREDRPVQVSSPALRRLVGTYRSSDPPLEITVSLEEDTLHVTVPGQGEIPLLPLAVDRFGLIGVPPGIYLNFTLEGDESVGAVFDQGPFGEEIVLQRIVP